MSDMSKENVKYTDLLQFLRQGLCPVEDDVPVLYTLGHACPDADALISSLLLALAYSRKSKGHVRVSFLRPQGAAQGTGTLPTEIRFLLGDEVSSLLATFPTPDDRAVAQALNVGRAHLILVDQSSVPDLDRYVCEIFDHHPGQIGSEVSAPPDSIHVEPVGATASLVADVWCSMGLVPDGTIRRILAGAILADTEGLSPAKARDADRAAIEWLGFSDTCAHETLWRGFLSALLSETDLHCLIARDFREFPIPGDKSGGVIGFAVLKCLEANMPTPADIRTMLTSLAAEKGYRYRVCLAKLAAYSAGNEGGPDRWIGDRLLIAGNDPAVCTSFATMLASRLPGTRLDAPDLLVLASPMSRKKLRDPVLTVAQEIFS